MDPDPSLFLKRYQRVEESSKPPEDFKESLGTRDDPFELNEPSIILIGFLIAIASLAFPITAVFTERSSSSKIEVPTTLQSNGSKSSLPLPLPRFGELGSRNSRREQK